MDKYTHLNEAPNGSGDHRPTAEQIIEAEGLVGKLPIIHARTVARKSIVTQWSSEPKGCQLDRGNEIVNGRHPPENGTDISNGQNPQDVDVDGGGVVSAKFNRAAK
ncbi:hypothetical protein AC578_992 [Pseudocercospora eumusae]|uniref:Uncharacterized protein n=1 Tax=Pseudocercospora eumusae TaxID=321146 RepID=A0A139GTQ3_9PEZI|nr:hypothetical protein AC578_992 [Pseudocercospora eumusae]